MSLNFDISKIVLTKVQDEAFGHANKYVLAGTAKISSESDEELVIKPIDEFKGTNSFNIVFFNSYSFENFKSNLSKLPLHGTKKELYLYDYKGECLAKYAADRTTNKAPNVKFTKEDALVLRQTNLDGISDKSLHTILFIDNYERLFNNRVLVPENRLKVLNDDFSHLNIFNDSQNNIEINMNGVKFPNVTFVVTDEYTVCKFFEERKIPFVKMIENQRHGLPYSNDSTSALAESLFGFRLPLVNKNLEADLLIDGCEPEAIWCEYCSCSNPLGGQLHIGSRGKNKVRFISSNNKEFSFVIIMGDSVENENLTIKLLNNGGKLDLNKDQLLLSVQNDEKYTKYDGGDTILLNKKIDIRSYADDYESKIFSLIGKFYGEHLISDFLEDIDHEKFERFISGGHLSSIGNLLSGSFYDNFISNDSGKEGTPLFDDNLYRFLLKFSLKLFWKNKVEIENNMESMFNISRFKKVMDMDFSQGKTFVRKPSNLKVVEQPHLTRMVSSAVSSGTLIQDDI